MNKLDRAGALAARGLPVFPLEVNSKLPLIDGFPERATTDPDRIKIFFTDPVMHLAQPFNIGVSTGRLLVVDIDTRPGKDGNDTVTRLDMEGYPLPATFEVRTASGGRHLYYSVEAPVKQGANVLGPGVDIRARGGYVVGPGSIVGGVEYTVVDDRPIIAAPAWLVERCGRAPERPEQRAPVANIAQERARRRAAEWLATAEPAIQGSGGNQRTFAVAARLKDFGVDEVTARELMSGEWNERCAPPWGPDELADVVGNAYQYGRNAPGSAAPEAQFKPVGAVQPEKKRRFGLKSLTDIKINGSKGSLVHGLLNVGELSACIGEPGAGKSYLAGTLAYCVASQRDFLSKFTARGPVVYIAAEREAEQAKRIRAWCAADDTDADMLPLKFLASENGVIPMGEGAAVEEIVALVNEYGEKAAAPVALIVIDTLGATLTGSDLNSSADAGEFAYNVKRLCALTGAHVMVIAHTPKDKRQTVLGSQQFDGLFDTILVVEPSANHGMGKLHVKKSNTIANPDWTTHWKTETVEAEIDGEDVEAVRFVPGVVSEGRERPRGRAGQILTVLTDITANGQSVTKDAWLDAVVPVLGLARHPANNALKRAITKLTDDGFIAETNGLFLPAAGNGAAAF